MLHRKLAINIAIIIALLAATLLAACAPSTAIQPTPTVAPTPVNSAATPADSTPEVTPTAPTPAPAADSLDDWNRPDQMADYAPTICRFLNSSPDNLGQLRQLLETWQVIDLSESAEPATSEPAGAWIVEADLDADGQDEIALALREAQETLFPPGMVTILDRDAEDWRIAYIATHFDNTAFAQPKLQMSRDLNNDGTSDLAYSSTTCGAHTCFTNVQIVGWNGSEFRDLITPMASMAYPKVEFTDQDNDQTWELVMSGGMIGSTGAGLQRERSMVWSWDGQAYVVTDVTYASSPYLYFKIADANRALSQGDHLTAIQLYNEALDDTSLKTWRGTPEEAQMERDGLKAFAGFRLVVVHLLKGDTPMATSVLDEMQQQFPNSPYSEAATIFAQSLQDGGGENAACLEVQGFAREHPEMFEPLNGYGYANPEFTVEDLCPANLSIDASP